jgi:hypothetical protein
MVTPTPTTVQVKLQLRGDTAATWASVNPVLLNNELGLETDTKKLKIGNGSTSWNSLAYFPSIVTGGTVLGNLEIGTTGTLTFEGSTADGFETTLAVTDPTADRTITLPDQSGTVVVTGNASIVNADIAADAEIAVSKLANGTANQVLVTDGTDVSWSDDLTLAGNLTVNGTTTTVNTETLTVKDKNIELAVVDTPTDTTADGGGITLKGATDKTFNWVDSTDAWTSSEHINLATGKAYYINGTEVLSGSALGSSIEINTSQDITLQAQADLRFADADSSNWVALQAPATVSSNVTWTLPDADGTSGQVLSTDGAGVLSWTTGGGGGATDKIEEGNTSAEVIDTGSDGRFVVTTEGSERARVDASGRLLVGTSSADTFRISTVGYIPNAQIKGAFPQGGVSVTSSDEGAPLWLANSSTITAADTNLGLISFNGSDGSNLLAGARILAVTDAACGTNDLPTRLVFSTTADGASSPTERMRINEKGNIWIGTTSDIRNNRERLVVKTSSGEGVVVQTAGPTYAGYVYRDADGSGGTHYIGYWENSSGSNVGAITHNNTSTSYVTSSDYRLKENVVPLTGAADRLKQIPVHRFNFIADPDNTVDGFIAHEAQAVVPECVTGTKDEVDADGNPVYQGIDQSKLVPLITAALQEALQKIETLEAANTDLAARITALEDA